MARHHSKQRGKSESAAQRSAARIANEAGEQVRAASDRIGGEAQAAGARMQQGAHEFAVMGERAFSAWVNSGNQALRRVLEMNVELATWGHEQMDDSISAARSLAQCRSVGDAYGVQLGLMRSSMEKSLRHASNVVSLAADAMIEGTRMAQRGGDGRLAGD